MSRPAGWYNRNMLTELGLGDVLRLRKPHPCGGYEWRVVRLTCGRRVLLDRRALKNRLKKIVQKADATPAQDEFKEPHSET